MHRFVAAACAAGLSLTLAACSGGTKTEQPAPPAESAPAASAPASEAPASSAPPSSSGPATSAPDTAAPGTAAPGGTTDPEKLDRALLKNEQLAGWQPADVPGEATETAVDPESCGELHGMTLGKFASDMGAMTAWEKDDLFLEEFVDMVDKGADSVATAEKLITQCPSFTMIDADERTPVKVTKFDAPGLGDRSVGIKLTMQGEAPVDVFVVLAGHKDVVITTMLQGEKPDPNMLVEVTKQAVAEARKVI